MNRLASAWPLTLRPLHASLLLACAAIGLVGLVSLALVTLLPLVVIVSALAVGLVAALLMGWAGIEALAACERWMERDPRFQR